MPEKQHLSEEQIEKLASPDSILARLPGATVTIEAGDKRALYVLSALDDRGLLEPAAIPYLAENRDPEDHNMPQRLVLKVPRLEGLADPVKRRERIRLISDRFCRENSQISRLHGIGSVPAAFSATVHLSEIGEVLPVFVRRYEEGLSLSDWMEKAYTARTGHNIFRGIRSSSEWFALARGLAEALEQIHHVRVVHGDLRPGNIILGTTDGNLPPAGKIWLINTEEDSLADESLNKVTAPGIFRRRFDSPSKLFEKNTADAEPRLRNVTADWYAPADVFSLGAILLELACGCDRWLRPFLCEEPNGVWSTVHGYEMRKTDRQLKNDVLEALRHRRETFPDDSRPEDILPMAEVIMACIRTQPETQASDIRTVLITLDQFSPDPPPDPKTSFFPKLERLVDDATKRVPAPIRAVMKREIQAIGRDIKDIEETCMLRVAGSRAHHVDIMITALRSLNAGDICKAVTTTTFFFDGNMGPFGRITSALHLASLRGVEIDWILVVNEKGLRDRRVSEVLEAQRQGAREMEGRGDFKMRFAVVPSQEYDEILQGKLTFIDMGDRKNPAARVIIAPDYRGESGSIAVLRLWSHTSDARRTDFSRKFDELSVRGRPVLRFTR